MPNKLKFPKFLPRDDEDPIVEKKPTFSPGKVKVEKMEKEIVIEDKGQEQKLEDMEKCITDKIGEQIGEYFKMFMGKQMPVVKPEQEKKDEEQKQNEEK